MDRRLLLFALLGISVAPSGCVAIQNRYSLLDTAGTELLAEAAGYPSFFKILVGTALASAFAGALLCWAVLRWRTARRKAEAERSVARTENLAKANQAASLTAREAPPAQAIRTGEGREADPLSARR